MSFSKNQQIWNHFEQMYLPRERENFIDRVNRQGHACTGFPYYIHANSKDIQSIANWWNRVPGGTNLKWSYDPKWNIFVAKR